MTENFSFPILILSSQDNQNVIGILPIMEPTIENPVENSHQEQIEDLPTGNIIVEPLPDADDQKNNRDNEEKSNDIPINTIKTLLSITVDKVKVVVGEIIHLEATLTYENASPIPDKQIDFYPDDYLGSDVTDNLGTTEIQWNTSIWKPGVYPISVFFKGDEIFSKSDSQIRILVQKLTDQQNLSSPDENGLIAPIIDLTDKHGAIIGEKLWKNRLDYKYDLSLKQEHKFEIEMSGVSSASIEAKIDSGEDPLLATDIVAFEEVQFEEATITLPKEGDITHIVYCPSFDFNSFVCASWIPTDIPFTETNNTITFTVTHFTAYAGSTGAQYAPSVSSTDEITFLGYKFANSSNILISTLREISCVWKPDHLDDGWKSCQAVFDVENFNQNSVVSLITPVFIFKTNTQKDSITTFSNSYSYKDVEVINRTIGVLNGKPEAVSEEHILRRRDYSSFLPISPIDTSQPFAVKISYDAPKYDLNQFDLALTGTGFSARIDPDQSSCGTLGAPGTYTLTQNVSSTGTCFIINSSNVILNCAGHYINYSLSYNGYAVFSNNAVNNITIKNCNIAQLNSSVFYADAFYLANIQQVTILNNSITTKGNFSFGVALENVTKGNISFNTINTSNTFSSGVYLYRSTYTSVFQNEIYTNNDFSKGILLVNSNHSIIASNSIFSAVQGIYLYENTHNNTFLNNDISSVSEYEIWDTTNSVYVNYLAYSNSLGGITWTDQSETGFLRNISLNGPIGLGTNIIIGSNIISVNTSAFPGSKINSSANISLKLGFSRVDQVRKTDTYYIDSQTVLSSGYNCTSCAIGNYANGILTFNTTSLGSFAAFINDTTPPNVYLLSPVNNSQQNDSGVWFIYNATDADSSLANCSLLINGVVNQSDTGISESIKSYFLGSALLDGYYSWGVSCFDSSVNANSNSSEVRVFTTWDTKGPVITTLSPTNSTNSTENNFFFEYDVYDHTGVANCSLLVNGIVNQTKTGILDGINNFTISNFTSGSYAWDIKCTDTSPSKNQVTSKSFQLNVSIESVAPLVTLISPANNSMNYNASVNFRFNSTDINNKSELSRCSLIINGVVNQTTTSYVEGTPYTFVANISDGSYTWRVDCTDDYQNTGNSETRNLSVSVDIYAPTISLESPANNYMESVNDTILFKYNVTDGSVISNCSLLVNNISKQTDITISQGSNNISYTLGTGVYNWTVACVDSLTNTGQGTIRNLTISTAPYIFLNTMDFAQDSDGDFEINFTVMDNVGVRNCVLYTNLTGNWWPRNKNTFMATNTMTSFSVKDIPDDTRFRWNVLCTDSDGNSQWASTNMTFIINNTPPSTSTIPSLSWGEDNFTRVNLTAYFSDINNDTLGYSSSSPDNITVTIDNSTSIAILESAKNWFGTKSITFTAYDGIESTASNTVSLTVSELGNTAPQIREQSPSNNFVDDDGYLFFTCNVTDDYNIKNVSLYHDISGAWQLNQTVNTSWIKRSINFNVTAVPEGTYKWNCLTYDNSSQSVWGENRTVNVGINASVHHSIPRWIVNNVNHSRSLVVSYSQYLNGSIVLGNLTIIELDDHQIYYTENLSNSPNFVSNGLTIHPRLINFTDEIFDGNFSIGNSVNLNITLTYSYQGNSYNIYDNVTITIVGG